MSFPTVLLGVCATALLAFPGLWMLASRAFAKKSGWAALAKDFAEPHQSPNVDLPRLSAKIGEVTYTTSVRLADSEKGLQLQMHPLLKFGHPPLLVPWSEVKVLSDATTSESVLLELGQRLNIRLEFSESAFQHATLTERLRQG